MEFNSLGLQVVIVLVVIVVLWLFIKTLKIIWKLTLLLLVFLALSFALPAVREWVLTLF